MSNVIKNVKLEDFHTRLEENNLGPLWSSIHHLNTIQPTTKAIPYLWKRELIQRHLNEAEEILTLGDGADRRAVFLINPGMKDLEPVGWGGATHTLYAAVQAVKPGEVASAHRHTATATRFILKGEGARGTVDGERLTFSPGDFLNTPSWSWHDHTNIGNEQVMWMDCLDSPFMKFIGTGFTEFLEDDQQTLVVPDNYNMKRYQGGVTRPVADRNKKIAPPGRYPWELTERGLEGLSEFDADPVDGFAVEYINPVTGKDANNRIGARMQKLPSGFTGKAHRHVHSNVYHVFKGKGYTVMNGVRFDWEEGDFFAIPSWTWHEHVNLSEDEPAYLYSTNDLPIMEAFDFEVVEEYQENEGYQFINDTFEPIL